MKRIFLICIIALIASCYRTDTESCQLKYVNESGVDIRIKGLIAGDSDDIFAIQIPNGKTYTLSPFNCFAGAELIEQAGLTFCDTVYIYYGEERMMMFTNDRESEIFSHPSNPISGINYEYICIKKNKLYEQVFTFTREMYDAATPIDQPAEE